MSSIGYSSRNLYYSFQPFCAQTLQNEISNKLRGVIVLIMDSVLEYCISDQPKHRYNGKQIRPTLQPKPQLVQPCMVLETTNSQRLFAPNKASFQQLQEEEQEPEPKLYYRAIITKSHLMQLVHYIHHHYHRQRSHQAVALQISQAN